MKPCTIYMVRHGETQANVDLLIHGHSNDPLTKLGEQQAYDRAKHLSDIHFAHIYSSDLTRAKQTAQILNLNQNLPFKTTSFLRERNYGIYEGKPRTTTAQLWEYLNYDPTHPHIKESQVETSEEMIKRAVPYLRHIASNHLGENILVVTHGGLIRVLLIYFGFAQLSQLARYSIPNLSYAKIESDGENFTVVGTEGILLSTQ